MSEFTSRQYNNDEVSRIIRRALKIKQEDTISHQDLIETARDIGIDPKILETAILQEQKAIIKQLSVTSQFLSDHVSNYAAINGRLPKDKPQMLATIEKTLARLAQEPSFRDDLNKKLRLRRL